MFYEKKRRRKHEIDLFKSRQQTQVHGVKIKDTLRWIRKYKYLYIPETERIYQFSTLFNYIIFSCHKGSLFQKLKNVKMYKIWSRPARIY